ncbi:helix-turn-helix transcriptional regulator [Fusobacterium mortiferum]|jgi:transcriptional regulator with XRE-family HTH domain|uniref:helix-turn-helix transcriptional regulator n=1 Tax=Fusobacterium mortiferum TaxID=850 RepID=UPI001F189B4E|nr:helix-turn-helix transcriptional regulator [Fusobacterium mortiferum]MCF2628163.1 helix-turn-helix transcriptional regulator [Fusobacterium mortiferum]MCF2638763.1 helix-turn-helix transcriptional regulator [Fusobacterium varium]
MNLADAIKKELEEKRITQVELGKKLNQNRQAINKHLSSWKKGKTPTISLLKKWCNAIGCDYKKFLPYL